MATVAPQRVPEQESGIPIRGVSLQQSPGRSLGAAELGGVVVGAGQQLAGFGVAMQNAVVIAPGVGRGEVGEQLFKGGRCRAVVLAVELPLGQPKLLVRSHAFHPNRARSARH